MPQPDYLSVDAAYASVANRRDTNFQLYWQAAAIGFAAQAILLVEITRSQALAGIALSLASVTIGIATLALGNSQRRHQKIESAWLDLLESEFQQNDLRMLHDGSVRDRARRVLSAMNRSEKRSELEELDSYLSVSALAVGDSIWFTDASDWFRRAQKVLLSLAVLMLIWQFSRIDFVNHLLNNFLHNFIHSHLKSLE